MTDKTENTGNNSGDDKNAGGNGNGGVNTNTPNVEEIVKTRVAEELVVIKAKLDSAYAARDQALAKVSELEKKIRDDELKRLQEAGKIEEALKLQLDQEKEEKENLKRENLELSRNSLLKDALSGCGKEFRTLAAAEMAYKEIVGTLVRNDKNVWVHKNGASLQDAVKAFADNQENEFLFKQKSSSGGGSSNNKQSTDATDKDKPLSQQSQATVLQQITDGSFRRNRRK